MDFIMEKIFFPVVLICLLLALIVTLAEAYQEFKRKGTQGFRSWECTRKVPMQKSSTTIKDGNTTTVYSTDMICVEYTAKGFENGK